MESRFQFDFILIRSLSLSLSWSRCLNRSLFSHDHDDHPLSWLEGKMYFLFSLYFVIVISSHFPPYFSCAEEASKKVWSAKVNMKNKTENGSQHIFFWHILGMNKKQCDLQLPNDFIKNSLPLVPGAGSPRKNSTETIFLGSILFLLFGKKVLRIVMSWHVPSHVDVVWIIVVIMMLLLLFWVLLFFARVYFLFLFRERNRPEFRFDDHDGAQMKQVLSMRQMSRRNEILFSRIVGHFTKLSGII